MRTTYDVDSTRWPEVWQAAYRILEQSIVPNQLRAWIQPLEWIEAENTDESLSVRLGAPNDFSAQWVRDHYLKNIESALTQVTGTPCKIEFAVSQRPVSDPSAEYEMMPGPQVASPAPVSPTPAQPSEPPQGPVLQTNQRRVSGESSRNTASLWSWVDSRYTFDNFVVGASNQFAHASAVAVAERPGTQYNPLFIYSPPGLGKTHLLHAIGNHLRSRDPGTRVAYISAESFVNELIESIQHKRMTEFRAKYRSSYDVLLIDDIQFIAGKRQTEEEFFHTFNALYGSKRQIILTSDRPPKEIDSLEDRIRTRFEWGLVADIQPPEIETRIAILKTKAERDDIYLPDDAAVFLATHIKTNVRELEGILIRLQAQASLTGAEISLEMAKHELKTAVPEESSQFTIESIQAAVARHYSLRIQDLKSTTRAKAIALPRQIAMYLIRKYTGLGFKEIGSHFGGKDHTTILHACNKIEKSLDTEPEIRDAVEAIQNHL